MNTVNKLGLGVVVIIVIIVVLLKTQSENIVGQMGAMGCITRPECPNSGKLPYTSAPSGGVCKLDCCVTDPVSKKRFFPVTALEVTCSEIVEFCGKTSDPFKFTCQKLNCPMPCCEEMMPDCYKYKEVPVDPKFPDGQKMKVLANPEACDLALDTHGANAYPGDKCGPNICNVCSTGTCNATVSMECVVNKTNANASNWKCLVPGDHCTATYCGQKVKGDGCEKNKYGDWVHPGVYNWEKKEEPDCIRGLNTDGPNDGICGWPAEADYDSTGGDSGGPGGNNSSPPGQNSGDNGTTDGGPSGETAGDPGGNTDGDGDSSFVFPRLSSSFGANSSQPPCGANVCNGSCPSGQSCQIIAVSPLDVLTCGCRTGGMSSTPVGQNSSGVFNSSAGNSSSRSSSTSSTGSQGSSRISTPGTNNSNPTFSQPNLSSRSSTISFGQSNSSRLSFGVSTSSRSLIVDSCPPFCPGSSSAGFSSSRPCNHWSECPSGQCTGGFCEPTSSSSISVPPGTSSTSSIPCTHWSQCPSGQCTNGVCVNVSSSSTSFTFSFGQSSSITSCVFNFQCPSGQCINGVCVNPSSSSVASFCSINTQCPSGVCSNGVCQPVSSSATSFTFSFGQSVSSIISCFFGFQCPSGQCLNGVCVNSSSSVASFCSINSQCPSGRCVNGICLPTSSSQGFSFPGAPGGTQGSPGGNISGTIGGTVAGTIGGNVSGTIGGTFSGNLGGTIGGQFNSSQGSFRPLSCGNGIREGTELCDDGNGNPNDGCTPDCTLPNRGCSSDSQCTTGRCVQGSCTPCISNGECGFGQCVNNVCNVPTLVAAASVCGNGVLENNEECDDANSRDADGCTSTCLLEIGICGDGKVQKLLGEQCETSLHNPSLPYSCQNCRFVTPLCGDGKTDPGEECDLGTQNSTSPDAQCRPDCSRPRCGDGIKDSQEMCDDGNRLDNDGCSRSCLTSSQLPPQVASLFNNQNITFPNQANFQRIPFQLPLAQLQPLIQSQGPVGDTGPAAVAVIAAGAGSGLAWVRRKRK